MTKRAVEENKKLGRELHSKGLIAKYNPSVITVRITKAFHEDLIALAADLDISLNRLCVQALWDKLQEQRGSGDE
jgi:predicted HicB family RNase H-like nuclease